MNLSSLMPFRKKEAQYQSNPFQILRQEIDSLFENPWNLLSSSNKFGVLKVDVMDNDKELIVKADVPGFSEKDLNINLHDTYLTLSGEVKKEKEENEDNYYLLERCSGSFSRTIQLPFSAKPQDIKAQLKNGVLKVTIKKSSVMPESSNKIKIEAA